MLRADIEPNYQILDLYIEDIPVNILYNKTWEKLYKFEKIKTRYQWKQIYFDIVESIKNFYNDMKLEDAIKKIEEAFNLNRL